MTLNFGLGQSAQCIPTDTLFPGGCPDGYTLQEQYYVPNTEITNATASTPGAVPYTVGGCPQYACMNAQGQTPADAASSGACFPISQIGGVGAVLGLFLLPGWWKLIGVIVGGFLFVMNYSAEPIEPGPGYQCAFRGPFPGGL